MPSSKVAVRITGPSRRLNGATHKQEQEQSNNIKNIHHYGTYFISLSYIGLSALPSSQGLYGFVGYFMMQPFVTADISLLNAIAIFAAGLVLGFSGLISAIRQGQVCANGIAAIGAGHNAFGSTMVMAVFPELYAILGLLVTILISTSLAA